jgi:Zn-dependent alcohol dehydrogenase
MINIYSEKCIHCKAIENGISRYCRKIINGNSKEKKIQKEKY